MINRLSSSSKVKIVNLIDPYPDEDAVKLAEDKNLKMNLKDSVSPVLIEDVSDKNSYYVIMPMKI